MSKPKKEKGNESSTNLERNDRKGKKKEERRGKNGSFEFL